MSIAAIEEEIEGTEELQLLSDEDREFNRVYTEILGSDATETTARRIFDAGVNFVRDAEKFEALNINGVNSLLVANPSIVPAWMFRDALYCYMKFLHQEFEQKYQNGDMNTARYLECVKSLEHVINAAIPVDDSKQTVLNAFDKTKKKCETILNDTI